MRVLAIDPGSVSGAFAVLDTDPPSASVGDLPTVDRNVNAAELARLVRTLAVDVAVVERVSAMPKQGVSSVWAFGKAVGLIHGVILGCGVPLTLVTPQTWKKHYRITRDKEQARELAIRLYPAVDGLHLKKHAGRAEALLLANYLADKSK